MAYSRLNLDSVRNKALNSSKVRTAASKLARSIVEQEQRELVKEFESHPVTVEIGSGATAKNSSGTLGGYGNLFSFIGFEDGSDPLAEVEQLLRAPFQSRFSRRARNNYEFIVQLPSKEELSKATPLPFEEGQSWAYGIEKGIGGVTAYIYTKFEKGRSKWGVQNTNKTKTVFSFKPTKYLPTLMNRFTARLRRKR